MIAFNFAHEMVINIGLPRHLDERFGKWSGEEYKRMEDEEAGEEESGNGGRNIG